MQDLFNIGVILAWPLLCCFFYSRFDRITATFIAIVGGFLLLPVKVAIDLPLFPDIDKNITSCIGALLGIIFVKREHFNWLGKYRSVRYSIITIFIITIINYFFNMQPIFNGQYWKEGLTLYELISACLRNYFAILPLVIGLYAVRTESDVIKLYKLLVVALLIYLPLVLFEIRFSPQLHNYLYGFYPHSLSQQLRDGGFRAMVFTGHGLITANIYLGGFVSLLVLLKLKRYFISKSFNNVLILVFLAILILLKSVTAIVLAVLSFILVFILSNNLRGLAQKIILAFSIIYPLFILFEVVPYDSIYEFVISIVPEERVDSLFFRLNNEATYITYLDDFFLIGYGSMGRWFIPDVIVDGIWLVWIMQYGVFFWIVHVFLYSSYIVTNYTFSQSIKNVINIFSIFPIIMIIDQLPNSSWKNPWVWLYAGALLSLSKIYEVNNRNSKFPKA